jgi:hypothetical protein
VCVWTITVRWRFRAVSRVFDFWGFGDGGVLLNLSCVDRMVQPLVEAKGDEGFEEKMFVVEQIGHECV